MARAESGAGEHEGRNGSVGLRRLIGRFRDLPSQDVPADDVVTVGQSESLEQALNEGERIVWRGSPSVRHSWADRDQLETPRTSGMLPDSVRGRAILFAWLTAFVILLAGIGAVLVIGGVDQWRSSAGLSARFWSALLVLAGLAFMSGLTFLAQPWSNMRRSRRVHYVLTDHRALLFRHGPAWSVIVTRAPPVAAVCLLLLGGSFGALVGLVVGPIESLTDGEPTAAATRLVVALITVPVLLVIGSFGGLGLGGLILGIREAFAQRQLWFHRGIELASMPAQELPVTTRVRADGVGDVVLGVDAFHEVDSDDGKSSLATHAFGYLSVSEAESVCELVQEQIRRSRE